MDVSVFTETPCGCEGAATMTNSMRTREHSRKIVLGLALLALFSGGCASVAASVAGGGLVAAGLYVVQDTAEETVCAPIAGAQDVVHTVLQRLHVDTVDIQKHVKDKTIRQYRFECNLVGQDIVPVDIELTEMSPQMTKITVSARRDLAHPELETAQRLIEQFTAEINRRNFAARREPAI